jgi:hypothetical protein
MSRKQVGAAPRPDPAAAAALDNVLAGAGSAKMPDDVEAAALRAQALRAGNRRAANERTPRLYYPMRPGWHQCWINDTPGNIPRFQERGYDFRIDPSTKERVSRVAGVAEGGGGLQAFLMEIPLEIYNDDMKSLEAANDRIDKQIRRGEVDGSKTESGLTIPKNPDGSDRIKIEEMGRGR